MNVNGMVQARSRGSVKNIVTREHPGLVDHIWAGDPYLLDLGSLIFLLMGLFAYKVGIPVPIKDQSWCVQNVCLIIRTHLGYLFLGLANHHPRASSCQSTRFCKD